MCISFNSITIEKEISVTVSLEDNSSSIHPTLNENMDGCTFSMRNTTGANRTYCVADNNLTMNFICPLGVGTDVLRQRSWMLVLIPIVILITIAGNLIIVITIITNKNIKRISNVNYASLAIADLIVGIFVMPPCLSFVVHGCWPHGTVACDLWRLIDFWACTISFYNLLAIAVDRYRAIAYPIQYRATRRKKWIICSLIVTWVYGLLIFGTQIIYLRSQNPHIIDVLCLAEPPALYGVIGSIIAFYIPTLVLVVLYVIIYIKLRKWMASSVNYSSNFNEKLWKTSFSHKQNDESNDTQASCVSTVSKSEIRTVGPYPRKMTEFSNVSNRKKDELSDGIILNVDTDNWNKTDTLKVNQPTRNPASGNLAKKRSRIKSEARAIRRLGTVMLVFLVCWVPTITIWPFYMYGYDVPIWMLNVCLWLTLINSTMNPFLYVISDKDYRLAIRQTFGKKCF